MSEYTLHCEGFKAQLIPNNTIGVCIGTCEYPNCLNTCKCYLVDAEWQPHLQDYATYGIYVYMFYQFQYIRSALQCS